MFERFKNGVFTDFAMVNRLTYSVNRLTVLVAEKMKLKRPYLLNRKSVSAPVRSVGKLFKCSKDYKLESIEPLVNSEGNNYLISDEPILFSSREDFMVTLIFGQLLSDDEISLGEILYHWNYIV